jgi:arylsulfatase
MLMEAQSIAAEFVATFKEFPPRQKPQSFNLDQIMEQLQHPAQSD